MTGVRPFRRGEAAQAVVETALVLPIMMSLLAGFLGVMVIVRVQDELNTATNLAAASTLDAPRGDGTEALTYATQAFRGTMQFSSFVLPAAPAQPVRCSGPYLSSGPLNDGPVRCTASVILRLDRSPLAWFWFWSCTLAATADVYPSPLRQCANAAPGSAALLMPHRRQRGQTLMAFAIAMALFGMGLISTVNDLAVLWTQSMDVQSLTRLAAQAGATQLDYTNLYATGTAQLDPAAAVAACAAYVHTYMPDATVSCAVSGSGITASVQRMVQVPFALLGGRSRVAAVFAAAPVSGRNHPLGPLH